MTSKKQQENRKKYDAMSEVERHEYNKKIIAKIRAERIAKRDPNAIIKSLTDMNKNIVYDGVSIGGHIEPANNWYKENTFHLMDMSGIHASGLSARIDNEIVKPINDYLFERTGTNYVHDKIPNYKGYVDVPNVYDSLFNKVCEEIESGLAFDFEFFVREQIAEQKQFIDEQIENKEIKNDISMVDTDEEIKVDNEILMPDEDMPSGSIH